MAQAPVLRSKPPEQAQEQFNRQFGIPSGGELSPELVDAIIRLREAGEVEGRRGSLTFFRWSTSSPPQLTQIGLWGPKIGNEHLALVRCMPDLEQVSIYETQIDDSGLQVVAKLTKLRSLNVSPVVRYEHGASGPPQWSYPFLPQRADRPRITGKSLLALAGMQTLEALDLRDAQLTTADLAALGVWPKLSSVGLSVKLDATAVKHLTACPRLAKLTLGGREVAAAELTALAKWPSLKLLLIENAQLRADALAALDLLPEVEELRLEDCRLKDEDLAQLRRPPKLVYLGLERNEIAGPGLAALVSWKLPGLGLEFNNINDKTLSHLTPLTNLENLGLSYCHGVTDEGIRSGLLQKMTHLKQLRLRGLKLVTDASLDQLVQFGHLEHINIRQTKTSPEAVERMKKEMPKTVVFK
jgi:hypothetical protein